MSTTYTRRKHPLLIAMIITQDTWRALTPAQQRALLGSKPIHPSTAAALHTKGLWRKDGHPTAWGRRVVEARPRKTP